MEFIKALKIDEAITHLYLDRLGLKVSSIEPIGLCIDGRLLSIEKDNTGQIIGLALE